MYSAEGKEDFSTVRTRELYLPKGTDWYDFWTGEKYTGGQTVNKEAPLDIIPLFVRAGSILPVGPAVQYATEKKWDNLEIRVYEGANGSFILYEDENDNYNYEKGAFSTIPFTWENGKRTLTIGDCTGSFPGMIKERKFNVIKVTSDNGTGMDADQKYNTVVDYKGKKVIVKL
jgi:alpha-D-xyloside xylohydrolase